MGIMRQRRMDHDALWPGFCICMMRSGSILDGGKAPGGSDTYGAHVLVFPAVNGRECGSGSRIPEAIEYLHISPPCLCF